ncbi:MAG: hypothetical protein ACXWQO_10340 [Bdellovibrionota bacterium]
MKIPKTKNISLSGFVAVITLAALFSGPASAREAIGSDSNGGGGLFRNGRNMTFGSAGLFTDPAPLEQDEVPQLLALIEEVQQIPVTQRLMYPYLLALVPTSERSYFRVREDEFGETVQKRLIEEFRRVTNQPTEELVLFAVTDTASKTTYLLPKFYDLQPHEQMAILFHEAYWLEYPSTSYSAVVNAEVAFQNYLDKRSGASLLQLNKALGGSDFDELKIALAVDQKSGAVKKYSVNGSSILITTLIGADTVYCLREGGANSHKRCQMALRSNLLNMSLKFPDSYFLRSFARLVTEGRVNDFMDLFQSENVALEIPEVYNVSYGYLPSAYSGKVWGDCNYAGALSGARLNLKLDETVRGMRIVSSYSPSPTGLPPANLRAAETRGARCPAKSLVIRIKTE